MKTKVLSLKKVPFLEMSSIEEYKELVKQKNTEIKNRDIQIESFGQTVVNQQTEINKLKEENQNKLNAAKEYLKGVGFVSVDVDEVVLKIKSNVILEQEVFDLNKENQKLQQRLKDIKKDLIIFGYDCIKEFEVGSVVGYDKFIYLMESIEIMKNQTKLISTGTVRYDSINQPKKERK